MSVLGGINEGVCLCCEMEMVAQLESARRRNCFYWKEHIPKLPQRKRENSPPVGLYHLVMMILLGTMRSRGWSPWLSRVP